MDHFEEVDFKISNLDGLGQGVSKLTDKITFIPKTLPLEEGKAVIRSTKKGVAFAEVIKFKSTSPLRIEPACPHFTDCSSCHYLHTDYEEEMRIKTATLERLFTKIPHPQIEVIKAPVRSGYRNRIQLHYDLKLKKIGMFSTLKNSIIEVPLCSIGNSSISNALKNLYHNQAWLKMAPPRVNQGHVEIYESNSAMKVTWNAPYAEGGFTQVFGQMNEILKSLLTDHFSSRSPFALLDLFAGNGNLSEKLNYSNRLCVDLYPEKKSSTFLSQDLYGNDAIAKVSQSLKKTNVIPEVLLLDPPRSGLKNLKEWEKSFKPPVIAYVSCNPQTLIRDLQNLNNYRISRLVLIDFFPSTYHFETLVILERN